MLYTAFPPDVAYTASEPQRLCCYFGNSNILCPTPRTVQSFEEITSSGRVNVMSVADKILKWNHVGMFIFHSLFVLLQWQVFFFGRR